MSVQKWSTIEHLVYFRWRYFLRTGSYPQFHSFESYFGRKLFDVDLSLANSGCDLCSNFEFYLAWLECCFIPHFLSKQGRLTVFRGESTPENWLSKLEIKCRWLCWKKFGQHYVRPLFQLPNTRATWPERSCWSTHFRDFRLWSFLTPLVLRNPCLCWRCSWWRRGLWIRIGGGFAVGRWYLKFDFWCLLCLIKGFFLMILAHYFSFNLRFSMSLSLALANTQLASTFRNLVAFRPFWWLLSRFWSGWLYPTATV